MLYFYRSGSEQGAERNWRRRLVNISRRIREKDTLLQLFFQLNRIRSVLSYFFYLEILQQKASNNAAGVRRKKIRKQNNWFPKALKCWCRMEQGYVWVFMGITYVGNSFVLFCLVPVPERAKKLISATIKWKIFSNLRWQDLWPPMLLACAILRLCVCVCVV